MPVVVALIRAVGAVRSDACTLGTTSAARKGQSRAVTNTSEKNNVLRVLSIYIGI